MRLKVIRIDCPEFCTHYWAQKKFFRTDKLGVFVPYDPNNNLLLDAPENFYTLFSFAAKLTRMSIHRSMFSMNFNPRSLLRNIFDPANIKDMMNMMGYEIVFHGYDFHRMVIQELDNDPLDRFPSLKYSKQFETDDLDEKSMCKQLKNSLACEFFY